jgi:spore germination protein KB
MAMPKQKDSITARQLMLLKLSGITGTVFLGAVNLITSLAGAQGYMAVLGGGLLSALVVYLASTLGRRFPRLTPFEYARLIYGKWLGSLLGLSLVAFNIISSTLVLRSLGDFLITAILPDTPISVTITTMLILVCGGAWLGIQALARFNEGLYPLGFLAWIVVAGAGLWRIDPGWLLPLFDAEPFALARASVVSGSLLVNGLVVLMFFNFVEEQSAVLKYSVWAVFAGTLLIGALQVAVVAGYSPALAETLKYPVLELARNVSFGLFLERIEALYLGVWIIGTFVKVSILFYAAALGLSLVTGARSYHWFIPPLAAASFYLSFQADSVPQSYLWESMFNEHAYFYQIGIVGVLLAGALLRGKSGAKSHE